MSFMATYKVGQGKQGRTFAAVLAVLVSGWGAYSFFEYGNSKLDRLLGLNNAFFGKPLGFLGEESSLTSWITPALVIALLFFAVAVLWARRFLNKPSVADHLIGTELEMRRVKWPTKAEVSRSASMVVFYVFWLALIIFTLDIIMATVVGTVIGKDFGAEGIGRIITAIGKQFGA
jgi:preprotein translocase SecE subunit